MSGDVQPRKRKDKRRRKDELSVEEPRGTAAVLGEGDVFIHSQHEHGTGGHWCAKIIFFSLLAVLVTLIGLIILENRGLSELEANSVESRYSGVLEGWIEDAPDDDHHDEHTLELKHHDEEDDEHDNLADDDHDEEDEDVDEHDDDDDEPEEDEIDEENDENENDDENDSQEDEDDNVERDQYDADEDQNLDSEENEEDEDEKNYRKYYEGNEGQHDDDDEDEDDKDDDDDNEYSEGLNDDDDDQELEDGSDEQNDLDLEEDNHQQLDDDDDDDGDEDDQRDDANNDYEESQTSRQNEEEDEHEEDEEEDTEVEVERIEKEVSDEDVIQEVILLATEDDEKSEEQSAEETAGGDQAVDEEDQTVDEEDQTEVEGDQTTDEDEFLEPEDIEEPVVVERITAPPGKPLREVEEETSSEKPQDTLADEEEYERQQEELRREQEQASHLWLKLAVGGALLVATHAVVRRATARDTTESEEHASREESPSAIDRRMTLIAEETILATEEPEETIEQTIMKEVEKVSTASTKTAASEEEDEEELEIETKSEEAGEPDDEDKELYSDEEEVEDEIEQEIFEQKKEIPKQSAPEIKESPKESKAPVKETEPDEEVPEDVEIIDDEQLEEELAEEEEEDEEEISDVDDAELLSRLEAKYGRLPEPDRPGPKKDGGNSLEDEWPGEPADLYWRQQLDEAERELQQRRAGAGELRGSARARYVVARALDAAAEAKRDNRLLSQAIAAYLELLKMNEKLSDKKLLQVTNRTLDRIRFRGNYMNAEPIYRLLIRRFPGDPSHRNNLSIAFLMANRPDLAEIVLKETLLRFPDDRVALAHLGFILKTSHNKLEEAVDAMRKALEGDIGAANEPRFYFHLGDALLMLGRFEEAHEIHKRGAALGHFLSPAQRSLYNVERLKSRPWWNIEQTPYKKLAQALEASWKDILKEGEAARALYEKEKEGLKERGEWSQLDLFVRGQELSGRCKKAPVTCSIVRQELAATSCKRGQIKFSSMEAGTHVRPHVGPTNCRLRMHLGLSNTKDTYIRVDKETRQWQTGKVLMFDDSFEHEVWHNGTGTRLVLIVDVWHPDLTPRERRELPAI